MTILLRSVLAAASVAATVGAAFAQQATDHSTEEAQLYRDYQKTHPYLYDAFSAGEDGTSGIDDLEEIDRPETPIGDTARFDSPLGFVRNKFDALYDKTGLRLGVAFTALGAWANGAGDPNGAAGDLDLVSAWTLVGRGTANTGVLVATAEYRNAHHRPAALGAGSGAGNADQRDQRVQRPRLGRARLLLAAAPLRRQAAPAGRTRRHGRFRRHSTDAERQHHVRQPAFLRQPDSTLPRSRSDHRLLACVPTTASMSPPAWPTPTTPPRSPSSARSTTVTSSTPWRRATRRTSRGWDAAATRSWGGTSTSARATP